MINASTIIETDKELQPNHLVLCPKCGQKLTDVLHVNSHVLIRIMCRRCKTFVKVDLKDDSAVEQR